MLFSFSVSLLGFAIVIRISDQMITRKLFERGEMTKIGTAYFVSVIGLVLMLPHHRLAMWSAVFAPLILMIMCLALIVRKRSKAFRTRVREAITLMLLKMKTGKSFRISLSEVIAEADPHLRMKLSEISSVVVFSQQKTSLSGDPFVSELIHEFILIDRNPHNASRRLAVLRDKLRIEDDFRRRSGQVLARIRAQSMIMTGLYLAVLIFVITKFGWKPHAKVIGISVALFFAASIWIWLGGRSLKWKV